MCPSPRHSGQTKNSHFFKIEVYFFGVSKNNLLSYKKKNIKRDNLNIFVLEKNPSRKIDDLLHLGKV